MNLLRTLLILIKSQLSTLCIVFDERNIERNDLLFIYFENHKLIIVKGMEWLNLFHFHPQFFMENAKGTINFIIKVLHINITMDILDNTLTT